MAEPLTIQALGLQTSPNELGSVPAGGLVKAENCVMLAPGLVGSRRGQPPLAYAPGDYPHALGLFDDTLLVNTDQHTLEYDTGSAFVAYSGTFTPPDEETLRMKFMAAAGCTYLTTDEGVFRLDVKENAPVLSGGPRNWQIADTSSDPLTAGTGFLPAGSGVAYRVVFGVKDKTGRVHLGPPSGRYVINNITGTGGYDGTEHNTVLDIVGTNVVSLLRDGVFWQLYRSRTSASFQTVDGVPNVYVPPSDEMYLVQEAYFNRDIIGAGGITIVDTAGDNFLGPPLYTNASADGATQQNDCPPLANDIVQWDSRAWFAKTRRYPQLILQIVGVGEGQDGYTGIRLGDQLTVLGETLTAAENYSVVDKTFVLETTLPDAVDNINATALSLVTLVNALNIGRAQIVTVEDDPRSPIPVIQAPGKILFQSEDLNADEWNASLTTKKISIAIGGLVRSGGNTVTATCSESHGLAAGDTVRIEPTGTVDPNFLAGTYTVLSPGLTATAFRYTNIGTGLNVASTEAYNERRLTPEPQYAWNPPPPPSVFSVAVGGLVRSGGSTVTVTTSPAHNLSVGMQVALEPVAAADANFAAGTYEVLTTPSTTTFTYSNAGSNVASTTAYQSGARVTADAEGGVAGANYLAFSKVDQPEAVPYANSFPVGTPDKKILRILPLENYLFVFKEDGVFTVSPTRDSYRVDPLDTTLHVYAPDSVAAVQGKIYALTNQGVVALTSSGYKIVSTPIEQELFQYFGPSLATVKTAAFGVSHETDRLYSLWLPALVNSEDDEVVEPRAYVYSTQASAWTTWELDRYCGIVRVSDDALFMGSNDTGDVYRQNNTKTAADYQDGITTGLAVVSWDSATKTLTLEDNSGLLTGDAIVWDPDSDTPEFDPVIIVSIGDDNDVVLSSLQVGPFAPPVAATGSIELVGASGDVGATIGGFLVTVTASGGDSATAEALTIAINADPDASALVTATNEAPSNEITLTAVTAGAAGNAITLVADGTGSNVSGDTLEGGEDSTVWSARRFAIDLEWRSVVAGSPADPKTYRQIHLHHRLADFYKGTVAFASDLVRDEVSVDVYAEAEVGDSGTEEVPDYEADPNVYPGMPVRPKKLWRGVPQDVARAAYLSVAWRIREAYALWTLNGFSLVELPAGDKGKR